MKTEMVIFDRKAVDAATVRSGYTNAEISAELMYSGMGYETALKRGRMPVGKFRKLVKLLNVEPAELLPKKTKPVQVGLFDDTAEVLAELKAIRECLEGIAVMLEKRW